MPVWSTRFRFSFTDYFDEFFVSLRSTTPTSNWTSQEHAWWLKRDESTQDVISGVRNILALILGHFLQNTLELTVCRNSSISKNLEYFFFEWLNKYKVLINVEVGINTPNSEVIFSLGRHMATENPISRKLLMLEENMNWTLIGLIEDNINVPWRPIATELIVFSTLRRSKKCHQLRNCWLQKGTLCWTLSGYRNQPFQWKYISLFQ